tara:strand:+ start:105 stop:779 length:675 start_codon:yes stop_codon:yes gene_type:complete
MKKNIAIITARAGSKRIKNKNLLNFFGKPIIAYSILAAKKTNIFNEVYVSTDSKKIEKISKKFGAKVPFLREKKLADDVTGTYDVIHSFLKKIDLKNIENICCLYPTSPLMNYTDIIKGLSTLNKNKMSYIFSGMQVEINDFTYFHVSQKNSLKEIYSAKYKKKPKSIFYTDAAQFYWASKKTWLKDKKIISKKSIIVKIPFKRAQDLNGPIDLKILRLKKKIS